MAIKFKKPIIIGCVLGILILLITYFIFGLEGLSKYSLIMYTISIIILLILLIITALNANKLAWKIEPEDKKEILALNLNTSLAAGLALIGIGSAISISVLSYPNPMISSILSIIAIAFVFLGMTILIEKFIPCRNKLLIIYKNEDILRKT